MSESPRDNFECMLADCVRTGASDLHLTGGEAVFVRNHGRLEPLAEPRLSERDVEEIARSLLNPRQWEVFQERLTLDLAYSPDGRNRYRINVFRERGRIAIAVRRLEQGFRSLDGWNLPPQLSDLANLRDGLVLVTGPTGSGKTTTLGTLLNDINRSRSCHIVTIEDPVEYVHQNQSSLVHQRELHSDVSSFADAVRSALREDPDVILVGEMRDVETIRAAITAAETGHLVFSTLHTGDAVGAIDRMIGVFSAEEQVSVRQQLSMVLKAVVAQRLLVNCRGDGRVPAVEILRVTTAVSHLIRTGKPQQIYSAMESGAAEGMQTMEKVLADLVLSGQVHEQDAAGLARIGTIFERRLRNHQASHRSTARLKRTGDAHYRE